MENTNFYSVSKGFNLKACLICSSPSFVPTVYNAYTMPVLIPLGTTLQDKDEVLMERMWQQVRKFIAKPKYAHKKKTKPISTIQKDTVHAESSEIDPLIPHQTFT